MTKLGRLLAQFQKLNNERGALYRKRSRARNRKNNIVWRLNDDKRLVDVRIERNKVSKQLASYLKKSGLVIQWTAGDCINSITPKTLIESRRKANKKWTERMMKQNMVATCDKLDLAP